ncbi:fatty acyl-CoA reductase 1 [Culex quinquefasciatus]|uniref:Fatty acyl-CoA reductase n=1 Tax=Culex quinquefasciatus TaxID=7176 RepID=B0WB93_CULQU|nr:fatty acyl-CoA reductase 1 [Culex quinquefasciatus]|eukprot:XP_001845977.1 fatty acyl-CoA reductase 1 [Culex quinquefasciatus]
MLSDVSLGEYISVPRFYAGADVFLTGGTGFMGKVLIEKLLRSCPDVGRIFVLMRSKRGKTPQTRVQDLTNNPLFEKLKRLNPSALSKLVPMYGDCMQLRLGMSLEDIQRLRNVSVVFHLAASVRFDDPLKDAILTNVLSTRELFELCLGMKALRAVVHVSTAYSNPEQTQVDERLYPAKADWRKMLDCALKFDTQILDILTDKVTDFAPNTYTFSKGLAEQVCRDYESQLPLVIFRPSIVVNTIEEPLVGWIDNLNGPSGMLLGAGTGIVRTDLMPTGNRANTIPADISIKALLLAAWRRGTTKHTPSQNHLPVYNSAVEHEHSWQFDKMIDCGKANMTKLCFSRLLWVPGGSTTTWRVKYYLMVLLLHILPAMLVDTLCWVCGKRPFLMKIQRKVFLAQASLRYFVYHQWNFETERFRSLRNGLQGDDIAAFSWHLTEERIDQFYYDCWMGVRRYLLNDPDESLPQANRKMRRLKLADRVVKAIFYALLAYWLWKSALLQSFETQLVRLGNR